MIAASSQTNRTSSILPQSQKSAKSKGRKPQLSLPPFFLCGTICFIKIMIGLKNNFFKISVSLAVPFDYTTFFFDLSHSSLAVRLNVVLDRKWRADPRWGYSLHQYDPLV